MLPKKNEPETGNGIFRAVFHDILSNERDNLIKLPTNIEQEENA
jgi:hypothetical protein